MEDEYTTEEAPTTCAPTTSGRQALPHAVAQALGALMPLRGSLLELPGQASAYGPAIIGELARYCCIPGYPVALPCESGAFDVALALHPCEAPRQLGQLLDECQRVLRGGGALLLAVEQYGAARAWRKHALMRAPTATPLPWHEATQPQPEGYTALGLSRLLAEHGFLVCTLATFDAGAIISLPADAPTPRRPAPPHRRLLVGAVAALAGTPRRAGLRSA